MEHEETGLEEWFASGGPEGRIPAGANGVPAEREDAFVEAGDVSGLVSDHNRIVDEITGTSQVVESTYWCDMTGCTAVEAGGYKHEIATPVGDGKRVKVVSDEPYPVRERPAYTGEE